MPKVPFGYRSVRIGARGTTDNKIQECYSAGMPHRRRRVHRALRGLAVAGCVLGSVVAVDSAAATTRAPSVIARVAGTTLPGTKCPAFPADNVWNTPVTNLPVNVRSSQWLASMDSSSTLLHPDYGPSGDPRSPYGIPWNIVSPRTTFTAGAQNTLPLWIFGAIRLGQNLPEVNAVVVSVVALTLIPIAYAAKISSSDQTGKSIG